MLCRQGAGHPSLGQERARRVDPPRLCSLLYSGWAREFYDGQVAKGKHHHAALRALGNRWLEILWHCLMRRVSYDEAIHVANRNRALQRAA
jgi:hypothetical protein